MGLVLIAALPLLLTEYGFQSRVSILAGFEAKWRWARTLVRLLYWAGLLLAVGVRPASLILLGLGMVLTEVGAAVLRRRMRIDIQNSRPHGHPFVHLVPLLVGLAFFALVALILDVARVEIGDGPIEIGALAPLIAFSAVALWGWATMLTVSVVDLVRPGQVRDDTEGVGAGEVIGILERMVTFVFVASGAFTAVGFVIAAKAAARFPLFKEKAFAEYFLIGTLTSVGLALLLGLLILAEV